MRIAACIYPLLLISSLMSKADILTVDFESADLGNYTQADLLVDWPGANVFQGVDDGIDEGRVAITSGPLDSANKVLEVRYPAGASSSEHSGASWTFNFATQSEVWAQYDIFIPNDTEFVRGGKLPGLAGGNRDTDPGFSNRMMWRSQSTSGESSGGATAPVGSANLVFYTHHQGTPSGAQQDFQWTEVVTPNAWIEPATGTWHTITHQVVLDSPGADNGVIRGYWNGFLAAEEVLGLTDDTYGIDQFYFSTFYGGNDGTWAPASEQKIYFDNFEISTSPLVASAVPEPSGVLLGGLVLMLAMRRYRRHSAQS